MLNKNKNNTKYYSIRTRTITINKMKYSGSKRVRHCTAGGSEKQGYWPSMPASIKNPARGMPKNVQDKRENRKRHTLCGPRVFSALREGFILWPGQEILLEKGHVLYKTQHQDTAHVPMEFVLPCTCQPGFLPMSYHHIE